ncbi:clionin-like peptide [Elysia marginata]|uniref:Clionin-like peptide n=1 Tax=Elysia marginata TaxID=1093978 RepID=A0AAV4GS74_9GAST|nr:clionin-like peptide [Elysia marginata]
MSMMILMRVVNFDDDIDEGSYVDDDIDEGRYVDYDIDEGRYVDGDIDEGRYVDDDIDDGSYGGDDNYMLHDSHLIMSPACSSVVRVSLLVLLACLMAGQTWATPLDTMEPVEPVIALNQMAPDHACLFICTMCFPDMKDIHHMMDCSNKVCGPVAEGRCAMEKFIWLGHHCKGYEMVERMWSNPNAGFH